MLLRKKERLCEDDASDFVVFKLRRNVPFSLNQTSHPEIGRRAVLFLKGLPRETYREDGAVSEEAAANDEMVGSMKFEKKGFTRVQRFEYSITTRLPEIDLVDPWLVRKEGEPVIVCYADVTLHF